MKNIGAKIFHLNSLGQSLLKLTAPGIPDIYQGTEMWDSSLVDPDNRRPVDFTRRRDALVHLKNEIERSSLLQVVRDAKEKADDGRLKLFVTHCALKLRRERPQLFRRGSYVELTTLGQSEEKLCAFARQTEEEHVLIAAPRLVHGKERQGGGWPVGETVWENTRIMLGELPAVPQYRNALTGEVCEVKSGGGARSLAVAHVFAEFPLALLEPID